MKKVKCENILYYEIWMFCKNILQTWHFSQPRGSNINNCLINWFLDLVVDTMVASKQLEENLKEKFVETMLIRHRHQNQKKTPKVGENGGSKIHLPLIRSMAEIGRKSSEPKTFQKHGNRNNGRKILDQLKKIHLINLFWPPWTKGSMDLFWLLSVSLFVNLWNFLLLQSHTLINFKQTFHKLFFRRLRFCHFFSKVRYNKKSVHYIYNI